MSATPYDFRKPVRLAPEWQNRLTGWQQSAAVQANRTWAKQLPTPLEVALASLDVAYAKEGLAQLSPSDIGYRVMIAGGKLPSLLVLPRTLLLHIISAMLGDNNASPSDRELTLVEENLADYFLVHLWLPFFREAWPSAQLVSWELQERDANPQCSRLFDGAEVLVAASWKMRGPWGEADFWWFFQKKGILHTLAGTSQAAPAPLDDKTAAARKEALVGILPMLVQVVLGTTELKLSQLSQLQVGDVILLDQRNEEGIVASSGGQPLFRGRAGRIGSWKAFRIDSVSEK
jgi:flagellar motor switch protein FliM